MKISSKRPNLPVEGLKIILTSALCFFHEVDYQIISQDGGGYSRITGQSLLNP